MTIPNYAAFVVLLLFMAAHFEVSRPDGEPMTDRDWLKFGASLGLMVTVDALALLIGIWMLLR